MNQANMNGDLKNNYEKLRKNLQKLKFIQIPTHQDLNKANPEIFLQILNFLFVEFSSSLYSYFLNKNYELFSKNDMRFMETIYQILLKEFNYKAVLNLPQFFSSSFYEVKIIFLNETIEIIYRKHIQLNPTKKKEKNPIISNSYENLDERVPTKILNQKKKETKILYAENKNTSNEIPTIEKEEKKRENIKHLSYKSNEDLKGSKLLDEGFNNSVLEGDSEKITYPENQNSDLSLEKEEVQPMVSIKPQELDKPIFEKTNGEIEEEDDDDDEKENKDVNIIQNYKKSEKTGKKIKKEELIKMIYELNENQQTILKKFDEFQTNVQKWVSNSNAQMFLLDNNLKMLKNNMQNQKH